MSRTSMRRWYRSARQGDAFVAIRVAVGYLLFGTLWIAVSDRVLVSLVRDAEHLSRLQTLKGWAFVVGSSILLYLLVRLSLYGRQRLKRKQEESERFLDTLVRNLPGTVYVCANDPEWTMKYLSPHVEALTGYPPEDLLDSGEPSYGSLIDEGDRERVWEEVQAALQARRPFQVEYRIRTRAGDLRWVWEQGRAVFGDDGESVQLEGFITDVTERRRTREELRRQMERLRALRAIDNAIMGSLDLQVTLDVVLDQVTTQLEVDAATVLTFDPGSEKLTYAAGRGFRTEALRHARLGLGEGYAGRAASERRMVRVADLRKDPGDFVWSWLIAEEGFVHYCAIPLVAQGQLRGVLEVFHRANLNRDEAWLDFLEALAGQTAIAVDNATLFQELGRANLELRTAYDQTIEGWARALDLRDGETEDHSRRVTELTLLLAERMGVRGEALSQIRRGALLHDIGKLGVPDRILRKAGALTEAEWEIMRRHPDYARELLSPIPFLRPALDIPYCHHEKWDGTGYPRGLQGEGIPFAARIFAVADVWDALRFDRPYRAAWTEEDAREHIREQAGSHFDPEVVRVFLSLNDEEIDSVQPRERHSHDHGSRVTDFDVERVGRPGCREEAKPGD